MKTYLLLSFLSLVASFSTSLYAAKEPVEEHRHTFTRLAELPNRLTTHIVDLAQTICMRRYIFTAINNESIPSALVHLKNFDAEVAKRGVLHIFLRTYADALLFRQELRRSDIQAIFEGYRHSLFMGAAQYDSTQKPKWDLDKLDAELEALLTPLTAGIYAAEKEILSKIPTNR